MKNKGLSKQDRCFIAALKKISEETGLDPKRLAVLADVTVRTINYLFKEDRGVGKKVAIALLDSLGMNYGDMVSLGEWILIDGNPFEWEGATGDSFKSIVARNNIFHVGEEPKKEWDANIERRAPLAHPDFIHVPKYSVRLTGSWGTIDDVDRVEANFAFRKDWVARHNSDKLCMFEVFGDSMEPFICEGDVVMVDATHNKENMIVDGKTYAISEGGVVKIKRLVMQGNKLLIRSTDQVNHPDYETGNDFRLLGRVVWLGHEVK